ncbi:MAG: abortive infection system antitoxin AbiGi family protein [Bryobacteraceae bacterium]
MSAISDNLIHFLARSEKDNPARQFDVFTSIIETGLRTASTQIKFGGGGSVFNEIVCFTDIPLRECHDHAAIYGRFGIGFKKSYVKRVGGNPARYFVDYLPGQIPGKAPGEVMQECRGNLYATLSVHQQFLVLLANLLQKHGKSLTLRDPEGQVVLGHGEVEGLYSTLLLNYSFDKEMGDLGPARDETEHIDVFYKEREWRVVPSRLTIESKSAVESGGHYYYGFSRADVNMVVVPSDEIRMQVLDYFHKLRRSKTPRLREFGQNTLPIVIYDDLQRW